MVKQSHSQFTSLNYDVDELTKAIQKEKRVLRDLDTSDLVQSLRLSWTAA
jgi:hypothetical protein